MSPDFSDIITGLPVSPIAAKPIVGQMTATPIIISAVAPAVANTRAARIESPVSPEAARAVWSAAVNPAGARVVTVHKFAALPVLIAATTAIIIEDV